MKVFSDINGLSFAAMKGFMTHQAKEHGLPILAQSDTALTVQSEYGAFGIVDRAPAGLRLEVEAEDEGNIHVIRDALMGQIGYFLPDVAKVVTWSDADMQGRRPPNFQFARVEGVETLSTDFLRVRLTLADTARFDDRSIHFRFVLPAPGDTDPEWPTVSTNGSSKWPKGDKALHRPVYTIRHQDGASVTVDIFNHEGGRAMDWARAVSPGDEVAIVGPGGGGVLAEERHIVLAGDETAFPAISRIVEALPHDARGEVILLSHSGAHNYPVPDHPGLQATWTTVDAFTPRVEAALTSAVETGGSPFAWLAAEAGIIASLRKCDALQAIPKAQRYVGAYWTKDAT